MYKVQVWQHWTHYTLYSRTDVKAVGGPELKFNQVWSATHQRIQLQVTSYLAVPTVDWLVSHETEYNENTSDCSTGSIILGTSILGTEGATE